MCHEVICKNILWNFLAEFMLICYNRFLWKLYIWKICTRHRVNIWALPVQFQLLISIVIMEIHWRIMRESNSDFHVFKNRFVCYVGIVGVVLESEDFWVQSVIELHTLAWNSCSKSWNKGLNGTVVSFLFLYANLNDKMTIVKILYPLSRLTNRHAENIWSIRESPKRWRGDKLWDILWDGIEWDGSWRMSSGICPSNEKSSNYDTEY